VLKQLLRTADLAKRDIERLLELADAFRREPGRAREELAGRVVVLYFEKPSTRTRLSFEAAVARLGGAASVVGPRELQLGRGETLEDTARVVSRYASAFVARVYSDADLGRFAAASSIPVINALTDLHHPCQSIADLLTLRDRFGALEGLKLAYVGAGNNVAHSLLEAAAIMGVEMAIATPARFSLAPEVVARAHALAGARNRDKSARFSITNDPIEAVAGADAVYTDTWLSMGDPEHERVMRTMALVPYQVNAALMSHAKPSAIFMHCLPAHRGEEVTEEIIDSARSVVFDQAENRLHTAMAILYAFVRGELVGSEART